MNLADTLFSLEKFLDLEPDSLLPFAEQDAIGGFDPDPAKRQWGIGSIFGVEGQVLYALVRALKSQNILEIGGGTGCSATHMASALRANYMNPATAGHIVTLDRGNTPQIPDDLKPYVTVSNDDAINYLAMLPDGSLDMIFEDADHSEQLCAAIGELAKSKLAPGGLLVAHDAAHFAVGGDVVRGYDRAGLAHRVYLTEPSDCGMLAWMKPQEIMHMISVDELVQAVSEVHAAMDSGALKLEDVTLTAYAPLQAQEDYAPEPDASPLATAEVNDIKESQEIIYGMGENGPVGGYEPSINAQIASEDEPPAKKKPGRKPRKAKP